MKSPCGVSFRVAAWRWGSREPLSTPASMLEAGVQWASTWGPTDQLVSTSGDPGEVSHGVLWPNISSYLICEAWKQITHSSVDTVYICNLECGLEVNMPIVNWDWEGKFEFKRSLVEEWAALELEGGRDGEKAERLGAGPSPRVLSTVLKGSCWDRNHIKVFISNPHFLITHNCRKILTDTFPFLAWHLFPAKWTGSAFIQNGVRIFSDLQNRWLEARGFTCLRPSVLFCLNEQSIFNSWRAHVERNDSLLPWPMLPHLLSLDAVGLAQNVLQPKYFLDFVSQILAHGPISFFILSLIRALRSSLLFLRLFVESLNPLSCEVLFLWENVSITMGHKHKKGARPVHLAEKN